MSATALMTEPMMLTCHPEVESASCECCGLTEDCTTAYIQRIRDRFSGKWICGLCSEAVKDEIVRSSSSCERVIIGTDEALTRHMSFCRKLSSSPPVNASVLLISAMRRILRRGIECSRSVPGSPVKSDRTVMIRSESCVATLAVSSGFVCTDYNPEGLDA